MNPHLLHRIKIHLAFNVILKQISKARLVFISILIFFSVDLVTLDDLSPEAMMESSERVGHLSDIYQRKCEPLSDPGPPGIMPPKIRRANMLTQIFVLWIRAMIYMYPFNVINWVKMVLLAGAMSVCVGAVFVGAR